MNKHILTKLIALVFACCFQSAQATPLISVKMPGDTGNYTTTVGSLFDSNIYINSIADLGGFDFTLTYDSAKFSVQSFDSGSIFGAANTDTLAKTLAPGAVRLYEAILLSSPLTQGLNITAPTLLGTVHFKALGTVTNSVVDILVNANTPVLSTFAGDPVALSKVNAFVTVTPPAAVPLHASALLFAPGLLAVFGLRKQKAA